MSASPAADTFAASAARFRLAGFSEAFAPTSTEATPVTSAEAATEAATGEAATGEAFEAGADAADVVTAVLDSEAAAAVEGGVAAGAAVAAEGEAVVEETAVVDATVERLVRVAVRVAAEGEVVEKGVGAGGEAEGVDDAVPLGTGTVDPLAL